MTISGFWPVFLIGALGGLFGELFKWYELRESPNLPAYARTPLYWAITLLFVVASGLYAVMYGTDERSAVLVANIGLTAPLLLKTVVSAAGSEPSVVMRGRARSRSGPSLREFIAGH